MSNFTKGVPNERRIFTFRQLLEFAQNYCSIAERCTSEVKAKLQKKGADSEQLNEILKHLNHSKFLSDERYAYAFARTKHKYNGWGPAKIRAQMRVKKIDTELIEQSIAALDFNDYQEKLKQLATKKLDSLKNKPAKEQKLKTIRFLAGKGFSLGEAIRIVNELILSKT